MKTMKELFYFSTRNDSLGLCLSGGGALGIAHIGVIQALEENGIFPTDIAGSSMGAIVGTFYAAGYSPTDIMRMIKDDKLYKITKIMTFRPTFFKSGVSSHQLLRTLIKELIPQNSFESLKKKMHICVANLNTAEWEIIDSGNDLDKWVSASASVPGVFETVKEGDIYYVDGGLMNNMPAQAIRYCSNIIGVNVIPHRVPSELNKPIDSLTFALRAMTQNNSRPGHKLCRFLIEPQAIEKYNEFSFDAYEAIYQCGYEAAHQYIAHNPGILKLASTTHKWTKELDTKVS